MDELRGDRDWIWFDLLSLSNLFNWCACNGLSVLDREVSVAIGRGIDLDWNNSFSNCKL